MKENREIIKKLILAQKLNKKIEIMYGTVDGLKMIADKEPEKEGIAYIAKRLNYIEILLEHMSLRLLKVEKRSNIRELIVREYNGKTFITDLGTGENAEVKIMTKEEYDEYINRRFGLTSTVCEDQKTHSDHLHGQQRQQHCGDSHRGDKQQTGCRHNSHQNTIQKTKS